MKLPVVSSFFGYLDLTNGGYIIASWSIMIYGLLSLLLFMVLVFAADIEATMHNSMMPLEFSGETVAMLFIIFAVSVSGLAVSLIYITGVKEVSQSNEFP